MRAAVVIRSLPEAYKVIKEMGLSEGEWESEYREAGRGAVKKLIEGLMRDRIDKHLEEMKAREEPDRRNGTFSRHLLTEIGDSELEVPRTRTMSAVEVVRAYARRARHIDRAILACFILGVSTRKVAHVVASVLGEVVSASTVSRIAKQLEGAVGAFHRRPLKDRYRFLIFDGVVLKRRTGAGSVKRVVLVALGITAKGVKEVIDFFIAPGESQAAWEEFLGDLYRRGLTGDGVEMVVTDGGKGLRGALGMIYPRARLQRCWAHKTRNVLSYVRKAYWPLVKADLHKISHAPSLRAAQHAVGAFSTRWKDRFPKAVTCLLNDEEELLSFFSVKDASWWSRIRTTNAIERLFVEVRRRTRPMGVFSDRTSMERIMYAVFSYQNFRQGSATPFLA